MNLIITKWLLVYVLEHKHNFHVEYFLSLTAAGLPPNQDGFPIRIASLA